MSKIVIWILVITIIKAQIRNKMTKEDILNIMLFQIPHFSENSASKIRKIFFRFVKNHNIPNINILSYLINRFTRNLINPLSSQSLFKLFLMFSFQFLRSFDIILIFQILVKQIHFQLQKRSKS